EDRDASVLRRVDVGAADTLADIAVVSVRRPDLLAVDDPAVAASHRARLHASQIRPCRWLAEQLTGDELTAVQLTEVLLPPLRRPVRKDAGADDREAEAQHRRRRNLILALEAAIDPLVVDAQLAASVFLGPGNPAQARLVALPLPALGLPQLFGLAQLG